MTDAENTFGKSFGGQFSSAQSSVKDLLDRCLSLTNIVSSDTIWRPRALAAMDLVYKQALKGRHWKFTHREAFIDLKEPYEVGTITLTKGDYEAPESVDAANGAVPILQFNAVTMKGQLLNPKQNEFVYRIAEAGPKKLTLANKYAEDTAEFADYEILFDRIKLDPKIQQIKSVVIPGFGELRPLGQQAFRTAQNQLANLKSGTPDCYTYGEFGREASEMILEISPAPDKCYALAIDYIERPVSLEDSDTCFPLIPREHDDVLQYGVMAEIYRMQNNSANRQTARGDYLTSWNKMASDQEMTDSRARVQHRTNYYARPLQRAATRGRAGRGKKFDVA